jgi:predicted dehydrogenase
MWLPNLRQLDEHFELKAICDLSPGLTESLGRYYNVSQRFQDYRQLVAEDLDAVIVLTPGSHAAPAIAAMEAGKHVIVEKPMCFTQREAGAMIAASKRWPASYGGLHEALRPGIPLRPGFGSFHARPPVRAD